MKYVITLNILSRSSYEEVIYSCVIYVLYRSVGPTALEIYSYPNEAMAPAAKNWLQRILFTFYLYSLATGTENDIQMNKERLRIEESVSIIPQSF